MDDIQIITQLTPNPNALKFVVNKDIILTGKMTYFSLNDCNTPLAAYIFAIDGVRQVHFYDNTITVTKYPDFEWEQIEEKVIETLKSKLDEHNPNIETGIEKKEEAKKAPLVMTPELLAINAILDESIRPNLQMDGGDIEIVDFKENVLTVDFQGACNSCPSATIGTLQYIKVMIQDYNPDIDVVLKDSIW